MRKLFSNAPEDVALLEEQKFTALGATATDVDIIDGAPAAFGLFEEAIARRVADDHRLVRRLPDAERPALPDPTRRPLVLAGVTVRDGTATVAVEHGPNVSVAAAGAFGVGSHPTTAMMAELAALGPTPRRVLDVGTGTGILSLIALRRGAETAAGVDIKPAAWRAARANAERSGLSDRFAVGERWPDERFDLVLANVRARVIVELGVRLERSLAEAGRLLLSGIRFYEDRQVEDACHRLGLEVRRRWFDRGWWCLEVGRH